MTATLRWCARACNPTAVRTLGVALWTAFGVGGCETPDQTPTDMIAIDTGGDELLAPIFLEPASGSIRVSARRQADLSLEVANIDAAGTVLHLDGVSVGSLRGAPAIGSLDALTLRLTMRGAMVAAHHTLQLQTLRGAEALESAPVKLLVDPEPGPTLTATLGAPRHAGTHVASWGAGLLGSVDNLDIGPPLLTLVALDHEGRWAFDDAHTVALPGLSRTPTDTALALSATRTDRGDTLQVSWRQGPTGASVAVLRCDWSAADPGVPSTTVLDLQAAVIGPVEYAAWGRPWLAGDLLLAELLAATDTETPRPGDRAIVVAQLGVRGALQGKPRRLTFGERVDLDAIGPALDLAHAQTGGGPTFSLRMQQRSAAVVELSDHGTTALRTWRAEDTGPGLADAVSPIATVVGALGSRTTVVATPGGLVVQRSTATQRAPVQALEVPAELADPTAWTSAPTVATIGGAVVVLLSQGATLPVIAVTTAGEDPVVTALPDLSCDSIAAPPTPATPDGALPLACARNGEIWDATLVGSEPQ